MGMGGEDEDNNKDYGEPAKYDPSFNGPLKNRSCTDIICCLLFFICFLAFLAVGVLAYVRGDPVRLLYPTDTDGNVCGVGDYADQPNLFFFDLTDCARAGASVVFTGCPTPQVCVKSCPNQYWVWVAAEAQETAKLATQSQAEISADRTASNFYCKYNVNPVGSPKTIKQLVEDEDCAAYYVESEALVGRCVPAIFADIADSISETLVTNDNETVRDKLGNAVNGTFLESATKYLAVLLNALDYGSKIYQDVRASWWMILVALVIAMIVSFIWIVLMRWIAGVVVWLSIILFIALFGFGCYYTFMKYFDIKDTAGSQTVEFTTNLDYWYNLQYTWLALGIICAVVLLIVLLLLIFLRKRILIAVALIKESSRAVGSMVFTLFFPIIPFIMQIIVCAYWGASALYLASMGSNNFAAANVTVNGSQTIVEKAIEEIPCDPDSNDTTIGNICQFLKYGGDQYTIYLQIFQLFMWLWVLNFIVALGQMTLAGAFASYYWAYNKPKDIPTFPLLSSFWRALRYHMGTIAFGALIIAIIQMIRIVLEYIDQKLKGKENKVVQFILCCLKCFFWCLEKFMKFINKNAYILCAIYGKNFCVSAKNAFMLIMRNIVRVVVVDKVTDFLLLIGKLFVVGVVGFLSFWFFSGDLSDFIPHDAISEYVASYVPALNFYLIPVIAIIIGSYIIAAAFFSVYNMAVDTLFLCFLEDLERHDGSAEKPYYMSKELMKILGTKNKGPKSSKEK